MTEVKVMVLVTIVAVGTKVPVETVVTKRTVSFKQFFLLHEVGSCKQDFEITLSCLVIQKLFW